LYISIDKSQSELYIDIYAIMDSKNTSLSSKQFKTSSFWNTNMGNIQKAIFIWTSFWSSSLHRVGSSRQLLSATRKWNIRIRKYFRLIEIKKAHAKCI